MSHYQQFDIPPSWEWTTLEEIAALISGQDFSPEKYNSERKGIPYIIGASNIRHNQVELTRWTEYPSVISEKDDLLIVCKGAGIGKMGINQVGTSHIARQIQAIRPFSDHINLEFLRLVLMKGIEQIISQANGLIPGLPRDLLLKFPIPLPPLSEQNQIVQKIVSILGSIDIIEDNSKVLERKISSIKSKILELAMQGKLVPQDPSDEPAADMLRRINPNAKIITDNPHSWNIPSNWIWISVKDVFKPMERKLPSGDQFMYIDIDSIDNKNNTVIPKVISVKSAPSRASRKTIKGDIVFSMVRPYLKNIAIVPEYGCIASTGFYVLSCTASIDPQFAFQIAISDFFVQGLNSFMKGDNSPSINKDNIENYVIPLPPMKEQKRIVAKIEEIFSCLDEIEASLQS